MNIDNLQLFIQNAHNPSLVLPNDSPNSNRIYHIYSDGEITYQKGGFAYLHRSEFTVKPALQNLKHSFTFPINRSNDTSYAIVTLINAELIRNALIDNSHH